MARLAKAAATSSLWITKATAPLPELAGVNLSVVSPTTIHVMQGGVLTATLTLAADESGYTVNVSIDDHPPMFAHTIVGGVVRAMFAMCDHLEALEPSSQDETTPDPQRGDERPGDESAGS